MAAQTLNVLASERSLIEIPLVEVLVCRGNDIRLHVVNLARILRLKYVELVGVFISAVGQTAHVGLRKASCIEWGACVVRHYG